MSFNKFNDTGASILDSYDIKSTLKWLFWHDLSLSTQLCYGRHYVTLLNM